MKALIEREDKFEIVVKVYEVANGMGNSVIPTLWDEYLQKYDALIPGMLGVCLSNEVCHAEEGKFSYGIGMFKSECKTIPEGFSVFEVPAALWGKFYCKGAMPHAIQQLWHDVFNDWLPSSGYKIISGFDFECYTDGDTSSENYESGIWLMLEEK